MIAFILAGIVVFLTLVAALLTYVGASVSDSSNAYPGFQASKVLAVGLPIAALVALSHWWPLPVGW